MPFQRYNKQQTLKLVNDFKSLDDVKAFVDTEVNSLDGDVTVRSKRDRVKKFEAAYRLAHPDEQESVEKVDQEPAVEQVAAEPVEEEKVPLEDVQVHTPPPSREQTPVHPRDLSDELDQAKEPQRDRQQESKKEPLNAPKKKKRRQKPKDRKSRQGSRQGSKRKKVSGK